MNSSSSNNNNNSSNVTVNGAPSESEPHRLTTRAMLRRVVNLTKHAYELQVPATLQVPFWHNKWFHQSTTASEPGQRHGAQSPAMPTYALKPKKKFDFPRAQRFLQAELNRRCARLSNIVHYEPKLALNLVQELSQQLRRVIKPDLWNIIRYKIVVLVTIVQVTPDKQKRQSMAIVSRCLWNCDTDGSVTVQAKIGSDMVAIATAFATYTD